MQQTKNVTSIRIFLARLIEQTKGYDGQGLESSDEKRVTALWKKI
jgi:hypothetical protein